MAKDIFNFMAYRLNKSSDGKMWSYIRENDLVTDDDVREFLRLACQESFDRIHKTSHNLYMWSLREGASILDENDQVMLSVYILGRSVLEKDALIVDDKGFHEGRSISSPAAAETMTLLYYWPRHIALVENRSQMVTGETWLTHYNDIMLTVSEKCSYSKFPQLENIPPTDSILDLFLSFQKVTRVKVHLKLPNPDMSRLTKELKDKLEEDCIQEIKQDMYNPNGLSKREGGLPLSSIAMAEQGYKKGPVVIEGVSDNGFEKMETGKDTAKGSLIGLKTFLHGLRVNLRTKEGNGLLEAIELELEKIVDNEN
jgi:hypothetical protein